MKRGRDRKRFFLVSIFLVYVGIAERSGDGEGAAYRVDRVCGKGLLPSVAVCCRPLLLCADEQIRGKFDSINRQLNSAKDIYSDGDHDLEAAAAEAAAEAEV